MSHSQGQGWGEGRERLEWEGSGHRPARERAPSHSDPAEQHKACSSRSLAKGAVSARPGSVVVIRPGGKAREQGPRAEAEREAGQAAGRKPRERDA